MKRFRYQILLIMFAAALIYCQSRNKPVLSSQQTFEQKALERQLSFAVVSEKKGEVSAAYNSYAQMIKKHETDLRVISGFIDLSVRANKVKECEVKLKELANKYPLKPDNIFPVNEVEAFPVKIQGFLAELFLRTNRDDQAFLVFEQLDKSSFEKHFIKETKAFAFYRAGSFKSAESMFLTLRKESKNEKAYSNELYRIYLGTGKITKSVNELFKMVEGFDDKKNLSGFNAAAELFRLFESEDYKDSILNAAEKLPRTEKNSVLLSELYFNSGSYEKAYSVMKNSAVNKNNDLIVSDFAVRLYSEKKYKEAASFFELSMQTLKNQKTDDFILLYLSSLELSGQIAKAVRTLKESQIEDRNLLLAELYHNDLDSLNEADLLYKNNLKNNKAHSEHWKDYIRLKIAMEDYQGAKLLLKKVFDEQLIDILSNEAFYEFRYMDTVLELLERDLDSFQIKSDKLVRDDFVSDYDNDLLKISLDIKAIRDDEQLLSNYIAIQAHKIDRNAIVPQIYSNYSADTPFDKKTVIYETNLYVYISGNEVGPVTELLYEIIEGGMLNNVIAKMFTDYSREQKKDEKIKSVLYLLLKSGISDEIKAEVREIIREKQLS